MNKSGIDVILCLPNDSSIETHPKEIEEIIEIEDSQTNTQENEQVPFKTLEPEILSLSDSDN